jgi:hypothetical protein
VGTRSTAAVTFGGTTACGGRRRIRLTPIDFAPYDPVIEQWARRKGRPRRKTHL